MKASKFSEAQIAASKFEENECEALAVLYDPFDKQVVGLLTEAYTLRRYSEEMDSHRREVFGYY